MNKSPLPKLLLAILAVIVVWSTILCGFYIKRTKEMRQMQWWTTQMTLRHQLFNMLVNDSAEYAKRNPAMEQLLRSINTAPQPAVPATKPATK